MELRGPDQSVRVRQVRVLGGEGGEGSGSRPLRQHSPLTIQHRACEQETLKVFRLITGQVSGILVFIFKCKIVFWYLDLLMAYFPDYVSSQLIQNR